MAKSLVGSYATNRQDSNQIGQTVEEIVTQSKDARRGFERRWYDNNFFDDGYHFRYMSRQQNKIVDLSDRSTIYNPLRAIPKSSKQVRGMANLLLSQDPVPVIYPEKINYGAYPPVTLPDPETGELTEQPNPELQDAIKGSKLVAKLTGHWVEEEFKKQEIQEKLALMLILAAKHGVSFMQVWPDAVKEQIRTQVYDAFDIYLVGSLTEISDSPYIVKGQPRTIAEIKADERFDQSKIAEITPDNRHASSEIKESYMKARYGGVSNPEAVATVMEKEYFIKEYLNADNSARIRLQENGGGILQGKENGDVVIRHGFVEGNITVLDEYVDLPDYPFVDFRFEPGPIYQVPMIERFIPSNKSLDLVVSRLERYIHTMVTGAWIKRQGEQFNINNSAGGQVIEYAQTPPVQAQVANMPGFVFNFMNLLTNLIEEQGVSTSILGKVPTGVRSNAALETIKESEYANLVISSRRLKNTIKRVVTKFLDLADRYFVKPQTSYYMEKGEPQYFDIIGSSALQKRRKLGIDTSNTAIPVSGEYNIDIQIESGLGYTREGQRAAAKELADFIVSMAQVQMVTPEFAQTFIRKLLELYGFGVTQEIIESLESGTTSGQIEDNQIQQMKAAMAEVINDTGMASSPEQRIQETKVGVAEVLNDTRGGGGDGQQVQQEKPPSESISFKDLPPEGKSQMAAQAGIDITPEDVEAEEQRQQLAEAIRSADKGGGT